MSADLRQPMLLSLVSVDERRLFEAPSGREAPFRVMVDAGVAQAIALAAAARHLWRHDQCLRPPASIARWDEGVLDARKALW